MYDRYAGSRKLAERALARALGREGNTASADVVWVAELDGAWPERWRRCPSTTGRRARNAFCA